MKLSYTVLFKVICEFIGSIVEKQALRVLIRGVNSVTPRETYLEDRISTRNCTAEGLQINNHTQYSGGIKLNPQMTS